MAKLTKKQQEYLEYVEGKIEYEGFDYFFTCYDSPQGCPIPILKKAWEEYRDAEAALKKTLKKLGVEEYI